MVHLQVLVSFFSTGLCNLSSSSQSTVSTQTMRVWLRIIYSFAPAISATFDWSSSRMCLLNRFFSSLVF